MTSHAAHATMPYNTRRKSLSLSELGITLPKRSRTASHPSPPSTIVEGDEPPVKKSKRSHGAVSPTAGAMSPPRTTCVRFKEEMPKRALALSPPPSPGREGDNKIDTEGINDDIVVGALRQLEKTGNRPHLVKELAAVLATNVPAVERSANPSALISSRLTAYLHRSWPAISPCPLAKDLSPVYPRRLYFYLTTTPHQPIPDHPPPIIAKPAARIISPSLSSASAADEDEDATDSYTRARTALSPSPEVDLSSPELDTDGPPTHTRSFSASGSVPREHPPTTTNLSHNRRAVSPQLEHEERDFKQTANLLHEAARLRRKSEEDVKMEVEADTVAGAERDDEEGVVFSVELEGDQAEQSAAEAALELFEHAECLKVEAVGMEFSSPVILAQEESMDASKPGSPVKKESQDAQMDDAKLSIDTMGGASFELGDAALEWESLQSPETIGVAELEDMFDDY